MAHGEVVVRFEKIFFEYGHNKHILDEVDFSIRRGMKVTVMGQNGAGKSTIFGLFHGLLDLLFREHHQSLDLYHKLFL